MKVPRKQVDEEPRVLFTLGRTYLGVAVRYRLVSEGIEQVSRQVYFGIGLRYWVVPFAVKKWWVEV